jgi:hypothetical protein
VLEEGAGRSVVVSVALPFLFGVPAGERATGERDRARGRIIHTEKLSLMVGV